MYLIICGCWSFDRVSTSALALSMSACVSWVAAFFCKIKENDEERIRNSQTSFFIISFAWQCMVCVYRKKKGYLCIKFTIKQIITFNMTL